MRRSTFFQQVPLIFVNNQLTPKICEIFEGKLIFFANVTLTQLSARCDNFKDVLNSLIHSISQKSSQKFDLYSCKMFNDFREFKSKAPRNVIVKNCAIVRYKSCELSAGNFMGSRFFTNHMSGIKISKIPELEFGKMFHGVFIT